SRLLGGRNAGLLPRIPQAAKRAARLGHRHVSPPLCQSPAPAAAPAVRPLLSNLLSAADLVLLALGTLAPRGLGLSGLAAGRQLLHVPPEKVGEGTWHRRRSEERRVANGTRATWTADEVTRK